MTDRHPQTPKGSSFLQRSKERFKKTFSSPRSRASSPQAPASLGEDQVDPVQHADHGASARQLQPASSTSGRSGTSVAQDQSNTLTQNIPALASPARLRGTPSIIVTQADPETSVTRAVATAKDVAGVTWSFTQMLLKRLPDVVDTNPVKIAAGIIKTVIEIKDEVKGNIDAVDQRILLTVDEVATVEKVLNWWQPDTAEEIQGLELYRTTLQEEWEKLINLKKQSMIRKIAAFEDDKGKIADIFERINRAREELAGQGRHMNAYKTHRAKL